MGPTGPGGWVRVRPAAGSPELLLTTHSAPAGLRDPLRCQEDLSPSNVAGYRYYPPYYPPGIPTRYPTLVPYPRTARPRQHGVVPLGHAHMTVSRTT